MALSRLKPCSQFVMFLATEAYETRLPQSFQDPGHFIWGRGIFTADCQLLSVTYPRRRCMSLGYGSGHTGSELLVPRGWLSSQEPVFVLVAAYSWRSGNACWTHEGRAGQPASGPLNIRLPGFGPGRERVAPSFTRGVRSRR